MSKPNKHIRKLRQNIGNNIHNFRMKRKMPLEQLSVLTGMPLWKLDYFEMGRSCMELGQLLKIADSLQVSPELLIKQPITLSKADIPPSPDKDEYTKQMEMAEKIMSREYNLLRKFAQS